MADQIVVPAYDNAVEAAEALGDLGVPGKAPGLLAGELLGALSSVETCAMTLGQVAAEKGPDAFLADATLFLEMFGIVAVAWQWLLQAIAA